MPDDDEGYISSIFVVVVAVWSVTVCLCFNRALDPEEFVNLKKGYERALAAAHHHEALVVKEAGQAAWKKSLRRKRKGK